MSQHPEEDPSLASGNLEPDANETSPSQSVEFLKEISDEMTEIKSSPAEQPKQARDPAVEVADAKFREHCMSTVKQVDPVESIVKLQHTIIQFNDYSTRNHKNLS
jgi:hypothetical protein